MAVGDLLSGPVIACNCDTSEMSNPRPCFGPSILRGRGNTHTARPKPTCQHAIARLVNSQCRGPADCQRHCWVHLQHHTSRSAISCKIASLICSLAAGPRSRMAPLPVRQGAKKNCAASPAFRVKRPAERGCRNPARIDPLETRRRWTRRFADLGSPAFNRCCAGPMETGRAETARRICHLAP